MSAPAPTRTGDLQVRSLRTTHTLAHAAENPCYFIVGGTVPGQDRDGVIPALLNRRGVTTHATAFSGCAPPSSGERTSERKG
jgi:hypothetical protein